MSELESHSDLEHLLGSDLLLGHWRRVKLLEYLLHVLLRNLIRLRTFNHFKILQRCILCIFFFELKAAKLFDYGTLFKGIYQVVRSLT